MLSPAPGGSRALGPVAARLGMLSSLGLTPTSLGVGQMQPIQMQPQAPRPGAAGYRRPPSKVHPLFNLPSEVQQVPRAAVL